MEAALLRMSTTCLVPQLDGLGGNGDFVEHEKTEMLLDPENTNAMANAMKDCYHDREKWRTYAVASRLKAETQFTIETMTQKTIRVIEPKFSS